MKKRYYMAYCFSEKSMDADIIAAKDGIDTHDEAFAFVESSMLNKGARYAEILLFKWDGYELDESVISRIHYDPNEDSRVYDPQEYLPTEYYD